MSDSDTSSESRTWAEFWKERKKNFVEFVLYKGEGDRVLFDASRVETIRDEGHRIYIKLQGGDYWYVLGTYDEVRAKLGI